ncbi:LysR substrate-binding domain-containing protein [Burkholderia sp. LMG 21824]|uniref:LysR substrate-binding domain-containing protein n=1 Tax=Burkholderia sp. LMG 21824 TaxID=3158172 RepID=UPI003C2AE810
MRFDRMRWSFVEATAYVKRIRLNRMRYFVFQCIWIRLQPCRTRLSDDRSPIFDERRIRAGWVKALSGRGDRLTGRPIPWLFNDGLEELDVATTGRYGRSGDYVAGVPLARSGAGLLQTYRFIIEQDLCAGALVEVLPGLGGRSRPLMLLYPHARVLSSRVRTFGDFLVEHLARAPATQPAGTRAIRAGASRQARRLQSRTPTVEQRSCVGATSAGRGGGLRSAAGLDVQ